MKASITVNPQQAFNRLFTRDVMFYANSRLRAYCDPYVPFASGDLANNVDITAEAVTYTEPYANYIHEGKLYLASNGSAWAKSGEKKSPSGKNLNFRKDYHGQATSHWEKAMAVAKGQQLADDISEYIKRGES